MSAQVAQLQHTVQLQTLNMSTANAVELFNQLHSNKLLKQSFRTKEQ